MALEPARDLVRVRIRVRFRVRLRVRARARANVTFRVRVGVRVLVLVLVRVRVRVGSGVTSEDRPSVAACDGGASVNESDPCSEARRCEEVGRWGVPWRGVVQRDVAR